MREFARKLRKESTSSEKIVWGILRNRRFMGLKFKRQYPVEIPIGNGRSQFYYPDFYCHELNLGIELDGGIHLVQKGNDELRDEQLEAEGIKIIRFKNEELSDMKIFKQNLANMLIAMK